MRSATLVVSLVALVGALAGGGCGSSSPGGGDGAAGTGAGGAGTGGAGGGAAGAVTFSCYETGELCTQLLVQPSGVAAETQTCMGPLESGTPGTGCPTAGLLGCCQPKASDASHEEQCYYDAAEVTVAMGLCSTTWTTTM